MDLARYDGKYVRVTLSSREIFEGVCEYISQELAEVEYGLGEDCLRIRSWMLQRRDIASVELLPEEPEGDGYRHIIHLETERLILRPWGEADAEELFRYASDPRIGPICGWPPHRDIEDSRRTLRTTLARPETFAIVLKETMLPIGCISLMAGEDVDLSDADLEPELGFWLGAPWWGRGLMTEAAREIVRYAFEGLAVHRIWCGRYEGNERSRRVQEKCGFRYRWTTFGLRLALLGEKRTGYVSCLTREEWEARRSRALM